ncbi:MAG: type II toxin-antitoxin system HicA family toxin [Patescibacteria group bacterium]
MKPLSAKELVKILTKHEFVLARQKGSHQIYRHKVSGTMVPVPLHGGAKPIPIGTFLAIVKQSKIPKGEFE